MSNDRKQFSLMSLLVAITLIAAGLGVLTPLTRPQFVVLREIKLLSAFALMGAGLLWPFRRARLGAYLGFFGILSYAIVNEVHLSGWKRIWDHGVLLTCAVCCALALLLALFNVVRIAWRNCARTSN